MQLIQYKGKKNILYVFWMWLQNLSIIGIDLSPMKKYGNSINFPLIIRVRNLYL